MTYGAITASCSTDGARPRVLSFSKEDTWWLRKPTQRTLTRIVVQIRAGSLRQIKAWRPPWVLAFARLGSLTVSWFPCGLFNPPTRGGPTCQYLEGECVKQNYYLRLKECGWYGGRV